MMIANGALQRAINGITNQTIKRMYDRVLSDNNPCQFDRSIESVKCGSTLLTLSSTPQLSVSGIPWYGRQFAGYQGTFKVSKAWSYQTAIEKLSSTVRYAKFASDVIDYTSNLERQGRVKDALRIKQRAFDLMKRGKKPVPPLSLVQ